MKDRRHTEIQSLGEVLQSYLKHCNGDLAHKANIRTYWAEVVGPTVAKNARPHRLEGSILWVEVATHAWLQELSFLREDLRRKLCRKLGGDFIAEVRLKTGVTF